MLSAIALTRPSQILGPIIHRNSPSALPSIPHPDLTKATPCPVISVADGDTVTLDRNGKQETVRLLGVDTPETKDPHKAVEYFGKEAATFAGTLTCS